MSVVLGCVVETFAPMDYAILPPPLTCYPCEFFVAFRDGPHEEVLQSLANVRADLSSSSDMRIPMQLDGVISAARQLVAQIRTEAHGGNK
jgi:hypothetical protein